MTDARRELHLGGRAQGGQSLVWRVQYHPARTAMPG